MFLLSGKGKRFATEREEKRKKEKEREASLELQRRVFVSTHGTCDRRPASSSNFNTVNVNNNFNVLFPSRRESKKQHHSVHNFVLFLLLGQFYFDSTRQDGCHS